MKIWRPFWALGVLYVGGMGKKTTRQHPEKPSWAYAGAYRPELSAIASSICLRAAEAANVRKNLAADALIRAHEGSDLGAVVLKVLEEDEIALQARRRWK